MISKVAYIALFQEVQRRGFREGVLGMALVLYQKNYDDLRSTNANLSTKDVERSLLLPTSIDSVITAAERPFKDQALRTTRKERAIGTLKNVASTVGLGLLTNFLFVVLMIAFFLTAQDTARSFFNSMGVRLVEEKSGPAPKEGETTKVLPVQR